MGTINIGIIGDYDGRPSHIATNEALKHAAAKLGLDMNSEWIPTDELIMGENQNLTGFDGFWCAPGSPYKSMRGALIGIQYARENNFPFIGTCGGFQHAVIEYARNVLKMEEVMNDNFDPYSPNNIITPLSCSLIGQTKHIRINQNSFIHNIYGIIDIEEKYNCSFGLNLEFQKKLDLNGFKISAVDEDGEVRILVLEGNKFYVATLFQPQLSSTYDNPHPLILAYLSAFNN